MPKVTIIVPAQDPDTHLNRCLESLLSQTEPDLEIIVSTKHGSTDFEHPPKDPRLVWAPIIEPHSLASTINQALKMAKADYILFVNPNDTVSSDLIETVMPWAQLTDNDLILFGHVAHYEHKEEIHLPLLRVSDDKESIFRCFLLEHKGIGTQPWQYLYKRDYLLKKNIIFDESLKHFDRLLFTAKAVFHCNGVSSIPKALYHHYKTLPNGPSFQQRTKDRFVAVESLRQFLLKANAYDKYEHEFTLFLLRFGYIITTYEYLNLSEQHTSPEIKKNIRQILKSDTFRNIDVDKLQLPSDSNRSKNTLSYKELQRLKTTLSDRFTLLEISYKITLKLLRYKRRPIWDKIPKFLRNTLLILEESKRSI